MSTLGFIVISSQFSLKELTIQNRWYFNKRTSLQKSIWKHSTIAYWFLILLFKETESFPSNDKQPFFEQEPMQSKIIYIWDCSHKYTEIMLKHLSIIFLDL